TLLARLQELQARQESLPAELQTTRERRAVAESTWQDNQESTVKAQAALEATQQRRDETYQRFLVRLDAYPVELLATLKQQIEHQSALEGAQSILDTPLEQQEEAYHRCKTDLEMHKEYEQNALIEIVHEVNNLLHEYGPHYDEQGIIRFQNAE